MKKYTAFLLAASFFLTVFASGCFVSSHSFTSAPPGQLKKATGSKSAKKYAPGQRKKSMKKRHPHK